MASEKEVKFKVASHAQVRKALKAAGARYIATVRQRDTYFDTPDGSLRAADTAVRLRVIRCLRSAAGGLDKRAVLTFKGPRRSGGWLKIRKEIETPVDDPKAISEIFAAAGLQPSMTVRKRRASYQLGRCRVELDELPIIGCFVEIEGGDEAEILSISRKIKLTGKPIAAPYTEIMTGAH